MWGLLIRILKQRKENAKRKRIRRRKTLFIFINFVTHLKRDMTTSTWHHTLCPPSLIFILWFPYFVFRFISPKLIRHSIDFGNCSFLCPVSCLCPYKDKHLFVLNQLNSQLRAAQQSLGFIFINNVIIESLSFLDHPFTSSIPKWDPTISYSRNLSERLVSLALEWWPVIV